MPRGNPAKKITFRLQPELIARIDGLARELGQHRPQALEYALDAADEQAVRASTRQSKKRP